MWSTKEKTEFLQILTGLCEIYDKQLSKVAMNFYMEILQEYDFKAVKKALQRHVKNANGNGTFFPKPADIISLIEGNSEDRAEQAWIEVLQALEKVGTWRSIRFKDPIINAVIQELGGWIYLGEKTKQEIEYLRHWFIKLYRYYARTGRIPSVNHLIGRIETLNARTEGPWKNHYELVVFGSEPPKNLQIEFTDPPAIETMHFPSAPPLPPNQSEKQKTKSNKGLNNIQNLLSETVKISSEQNSVKSES